MVDMEHTAENYFSRRILPEAVLGLSLCLQIDLHTIFFSLMAVSVINITTPLNHQKFPLVIVLKISSFGAFAAANLFTLSVFMELSSIIIFILIAQSPYAKKIRAAHIYISYSAVSGFILLCSACLLSLGKENTLFSSMGFLPNTNLTTAATSATVVALFIKIPTAPFHH